MVDEVDEMTTTTTTDVETLGVESEMSLLSITDGENERGIPVVKFIDDLDGFSNQFTPPAPAELIIGAYSELHSKFKTFETSLTQKRKFSIRMGWVGSALTSSASASSCPVRSLVGNLLRPNH